jgi:hypothetical protein
MEYKATLLLLRAVQRRRGRIFRRAFLNALHTLRVLFNRHVKRFLGRRNPRAVTTIIFFLQWMKVSASTDPETQEKLALASEALGCVRASVRGASRR